jgi:shikimate 5-dehydrogenase
MMNDDNSITTQTLLYGFIAENAHSNRFSAIVNKLFKGNSVNAMCIPMNIRPDDVTFTISQMRSSKLNGAMISTEYQEEVFGLLDHASALVQDHGYCDFIRIVNGELIGDLIMPMALEKFAQSDAFEDDIALNSLCHYFYELTKGEKYE